MDIQQEMQLSFWDSIMVSAAEFAQYDYLLSEDFNTGQSYHGVLAISPFDPNNPLFK